MQLGRTSNPGYRKRAIENIYDALSVTDMLEEPTLRAMMDVLANITPEQRPEDENDMCTCGGSILDPHRRGQHKDLPPMPANALAEPT